MSDYLYHCVNKKCKLYRKQKSLTMKPFEHRQTTGGPVRCGKCGEALVYDGEQGRLFEERARKMGLPSTQEVQRDVTHAVFQVCGSTRPLEERGTICYIMYVSLRGVSRGAVLPYLLDQVRTRYGTLDVKFMFWCDGSCSTGGSPTPLRLVNNIVMEGF